VTSIAPDPSLHRPEALDELVRDANATLTPFVWSWGTTLRARDEIVLIEGARDGAYTLHAVPRREMVARLYVRKLDGPARLLERAPVPPPGRVYVVFIAACGCGRGRSVPCEGGTPIDAAAPNCRTAGSA
jgi:hypothetical protein